MRTRLITTITLLLASALVGCTDSNGTEPSPWPSPTGSTSASARTKTPTEPEPPELANAVDADGSRAFVTYWVELLNYAVATGETAQLRAISRDDCRACRAISKRIETTYQRGGTIETAGWKVVTMRLQTLSDVVATVNIAKQSVRTSSTSSVKTFRASRVRFAFHLQYRRDRWVMREIGRLS